MTPLEIALGYIRRGWNPVPVPFRQKGPRDDDWQSRVIGAADAPKHFNGGAQNVGVVLGPTSGGLTDIDLDCTEAVALAAHLLPKTSAVFGRTSKPASHYLFLTRLGETQGKAAIGFRDPTTKAMLVEVRCGGAKGAQTVFPGSTHETGEPITWSRQGEPAAYDDDKLRQRVAALAAGCLFARYWPGLGARHDTALTLGGFLARVGWTENDIEHFVGVVAGHAGCENVEAKAKAARDAAAEFRAGRKARGMPALIEAFGEPVASRVGAWLGFRDEPDRERAEQQSDAPRAPIRATPFQWCEPSAIPMREWLYGRHLIRRYVSATFAPGAAGKSSLMIVEALALATGKPLLGVQPPRPLRVWYVNLEDPQEEVRRRFAAACLHYGVTPGDIGDRLFIDSGRDQEIIIATETKDGLRIAEPVVSDVIGQLTALEIDVLMVDPFVSSHRVTENDNMKVDVVAKTWNRIAEIGLAAIDLAHHVRKGQSGQAEFTVEDGRGAGALLAAARSARVLNVMTKAQAAEAGLMSHRGYFRADNGKANLAPPPDRSDWFRMHSVQLGNGTGGNLDFGDHVGVVTPWTWPDPLADMSVKDLRAAQAAVRAGGPWRENIQAREWVGRPIAHALKLDPDNKADRARVQGMLKAWLATGMFVVVKGLDDKSKPRPFVEVGEAATD